MTLVTLQEARARLPELIQLMATGEKIVIAEGEKWVAALAAPPPMPPTPEEEAACEARAKEAIRETVRGWIEEGVQLPDGHPLLKLLEEEA